MTIEHVQRRTAGWVLLGLALAVLWSTPAAAQDEKRDECPGEEQTRYYIDAIKVEGLDRTEPYVVERELTFDEGDVVRCERVRESLQRVHNTDLFSDVDYALEPVDADEVDSAPAEEVRPVELTIEPDEKWTALPMFQFSQGGGALRLMIGANETNLLGHYLSVGGQFEYLEGAESFFAWFENPRTFDNRLTTRLEAGTQNRAYHLYDEAGELDGGFFLRRFTAAGLARQEWKWWLRTEAELRLEDDRFNDELLSPSVERARGDDDNPDPARLIKGRVAAIFGRIDQREYLEDGTELKLSLEHANEQLGSTDDLVRFGLNLAHFETLPLRSNLAARFEAGLASVETPQHRYHLGGLDAVRGFPYDRFNGEHFWLSSVEYRLPSIDLPWLVLQHTAFVDAAGVGDEARDAVGLSGASAGLGLRIIVPEIHGLVVRTDYAIGLYGDTQNPWSLAGAQFY